MGRQREEESTLVGCVTGVVEGVLYGYDSYLLVNISVNRMGGKAQGSRLKVWSYDDALALCSRSEQEHEEHAEEWSSRTWAPEELVVRRLTRSEPAAWIREYNQALAYYRIPADWLGQRLARTA